MLKLTPVTFTVWLGFVLEELLLFELEELLPELEELLLLELDEELLLLELDEELFLLSLSLLLTSSSPELFNRLSC